MVDRLRILPSGRRAKWVVLAVWLLAVAGLAPLQAKLQDATTNDPATFLPSSSESTRVLHTLQDRFRNGRTTPALVVYRRDAGLTSADTAAAEAQLARLRANLPPETLPPT